jgi:hypothetical protein
MISSDSELIPRKNEFGSGKPMIGSGPRSGDGAPRIEGNESGFFESGYDGGHDSGFFGSGYDSGFGFDGSKPFMGYDSGFGSSATDHEPGDYFVGSMPTFDGSKPPASKEMQNKNDAKDSSKGDTGDFKSQDPSQMFGSPRPKNLNGKSGDAAGKSPEDVYDLSRSPYDEKSEGKQDKSPEDFFSERTSFSDSSPSSSPSASRGPSGESGSDCDK